MTARRVRVGCDFRFSTDAPVHSVVQVQPRRDGEVRLVREAWKTDPTLDVRDFRDVYGNRCRRLTMPGDDLALTYDALVDVPPASDDHEPGAAQVPIDDLPDDTLAFTLPSRYCLSDALSDAAWELFGATDMGWARVQAVCDWVHENIRFEMGASTSLTTAIDVFERRIGVCRDFAHLSITFCRALNIPARYVFGYLPDIGVPPAPEPMDFCAWFDAFLGGRWWTFDARYNTPRTGRIPIGRGRDALDVAMVTTYGGAQLKEMVVWADEVEQGKHGSQRPAPESSESSTGGLERRV
ncbi:MAG: transglutaminase-like domain-containing protein [Actinomycetota bacterium]